MAREVLSNGVIVPEKYTRDWFDDFRTNLVKLNDAITAIAGKQNALTQEQLDAVNSAITSQKVTAYDDHIADTSKHLTDGTASKAIADEDGTSIKTGYVNVAGNQTVTGQKTWSSNAFFNSDIYRRHTTYELGNTPASNVVLPIYFVDKNNANTGYVRNVVLSTGKTQSELYARNKFASGALSPTGTNVSSTLQVEVQSNGDKTLYFDGSIRNNVLPYATNTYSLGSSSYQWSSVYAQTYYYNGTAWGLDKANVWSNEQTILQSTTAQFKLKNSNIAIGDEVPSSQKTLGSLTFTDSNGINMGFMDLRDSNLGNTFVRILVRQKYDANGNRSASGTTYDSGIDIGVLNDKTPFVVPTSNAKAQLGTSTNKWKTLNGVNPGALSLPDLNNTIDITSTFNTSIDKTQTVNSYTADFTGWLFINWWTEGLTNPFYVYVYCTNSATDNNLLHAVWGQSFSISGNVDYILTQFPVISGKTYWFVTNFSRASTDTKNLAYSVRKLPCLGNV